jgi:hypothetical protein
MIEDDTTNNRAATTNNDSKSFDEILLEIGLKNYENHYNRYKDIDTKAFGVITITGILITFLTKPTNTDCLTTTFFILTMLSFLITVALSVYVIRPHKYEAISTENLIKLSEVKKDDQISKTVGTIAAAEKSMCGVANIKGEDLKWSIYSLGFSVVMLIFYSILSH